MLLKNCCVLKNLTRAIRYSSVNMSKKAVVFLAEGAEEMEAVIAIDVLRRGGVEVTVAGLSGKEPIKCSRGVLIKPDIDIEGAQTKGPYDALVLPGGLGGAKALAQNAVVGKMIQEQEKEGRIVAAICAAPTALKAHGVGVGKLITSYPSFEKELSADGKYKYSQDNVVKDGNITTSRGPGTAFDFALNLVSQLAGKEKASEVAKAMLLSY